jgi:hypothetical protein
LTRLNFSLGAPPTRWLGESGVTSQENLFPVRAVLEKPVVIAVKKFSAWPRRNRRGHAADFVGKLRMALFCFGLCHARIVQRAHGKKNLFDRTALRLYAGVVRPGLTKTLEFADAQLLRRAPLPRSYSEFLGRKLFLFC